MGDCTPDMGNATEVNDVDTFIITAYPSGADPGFFSRGSKITEIQPLSTFKQMLAVSICFNKRHRSPCI